MSGNKKVSTEKNSPNGIEIWNLSQDKVYQEFLKSELQNRHEFKINQKVDDLIFQYDIKQDAFDELASSYVYKIPIWFASVMVLLSFLAFFGTIVTISINLYAPKSFATFESKCDEILICDSSLNLVCSATSKVCVCSNSNLVWNNSSCDPKRNYGEYCDLNITCRQDLELYCTNSDFEACNCPKPSKPNMCDCLSTHYFHPTLNRCVKQMKYESQCKYEQQCNTQIGLTCQSEHCQCPKSQYFNGSLCVSKKKYKVDYCNSSIECDDNKGLICSNNSCQCQNEFYFDEKQEICSRIKTIDERCLFEIECNSINQNLECNGTNCVCSFGFWSQWLKKCLECDDSMTKNWTRLGNNGCYYFSNNSLSWNEAAIECSKMESTLCVISSIAELDLIQSYFLGSENQQFWIGGYSEVVGSFKWVDNSNVDRSSPFWCAGKPNNSGGNVINLVEACLAIDQSRSDFCLDDLSCQQKKKFCCEKTNH